MRRTNGSVVASVGAALLVIGCGGAATPGSSAPSTASPPSATASLPSATAAPSIAASPAASPVASDTMSVKDGEAWVLFQRLDGAGDESIVLVRPDGTGLHQLVPDLAGGELHPDWSPDGRRVAFIHLNAQDQTELWDLDVSTSEATKLATCEAPCNEWNYPDWAPDGSAIYFGTSSHADGGPPTTFGVCRFDLATATVSTVIDRTDGMTLEQPRVSPDGQAIAYMRFLDILDETQGASIYVGSIADGTDRRLTKPAMTGGHPDWTPDGRLIFDTFDLNFFQDTDEPSNLYVMDADGSHLREITSKGPRDRATQPRVTPDGTAITYTSVVGPGNGTRTLATIGLDGSDDRRLVDPPVVGTHAQLRPLP